MIRGSGFRVPMRVLSPDLWLTISPHLDLALSLSEGERINWLATMRTRSPELSELLSELLDEHQALVKSSFLESSPLEALSASILSTCSWSGETVGAYTLVSPIGEGGTGTVWLAHRSDGRFDRRVVVKLLHLHLTGNAAAQRFEREGQILGRLSHNHIALLLDAGIAEHGQPYLVLEYVEGEPIDTYCNNRGLNLAQRVSLFLNVLGAVAHAHANLVVHRDIKPSNVFVSNEGEVKLLDFGIAKLLADEAGALAASSLTLENGAGLTPQFAAPEQITGGAITTATDVYALGVLLYLLLTGQHPAGKGPHNPAELVRAIVEHEPSPLSDVVVSKQIESDVLSANAASRATTPDKLRRSLRGDLNNIAGKALKKQTQDRYTSVTAFAEDLRRYLNNEPISARPDSFAYRTSKFLRRNRTAMSAVTLALVAIAAGVAGILSQAGLVRTQRDFALRQLARADAVNALNGFVLSDASPSGKPFTVEDLLKRAELLVERQSADQTSRVELLIEIGDQYKVQDNYGKALDVLEQAYRLSRPMSDVSIRARAGCSLAQALSRTGNGSRAEPLLREGLQALPNEPLYVADRIQCLERGSEVARNRGAPDIAIQRANAARGLLKKLPVPSQLADLNSLMTLASAYDDAGRYNDSDATFRQASELLTELGRDDTQRAGTLFNNWGVMLIRAGRPLAAEEALKHSIKISQIGGAEEDVPAMSLIVYARVLRDLGRLNRASDYADRGIVAARQHGDETAFCQGLLIKAAISRENGDLPRSQQTLDELEPRLHRLLPAGHIGFASFAVERALNLQAAGDPQTAMTFFNRAIAFLEDLLKHGREGGERLSMVLTRRSTLHYQMGRYSEAEQDARAALNSLHETAALEENFDYRRARLLGAWTRSSITAESSGSEGFISSRQTAPCQYTWPGSS